MRISLSLSQALSLLIADQLGSNRKQIKHCTYHVIDGHAPGCKAIQVGQVGARDSFCARRAVGWHNDAPAKRN